MSGVALTYAFSARPFAFLPTVTRRVIRLGLPMTAATILAAVLYALLPDAHATAAAYTGSPWLRTIGPVSPSVTAIIHQIVFEGLLVGFDGCSLLPGWAIGHLTLAGEHAFDAPLWTLHIEFCGIAASLVLAFAFERWVDHPAIKLSRMIDARRRPSVSPLPVSEAV